MRLHRTRFSRCTASSRLFSLSSVVVLLLAGLFPVHSLQAAPARHALVIGNGGYAQMPLRNPVNDAEDMAAALREVGFEVTLKIDADQRTMEESIRAFSQRLREDTVGLFYYAGHGVQSEGRNYLIPLGAGIQNEPDLRYEAVDAGYVLDYMAAAGNGLNIVILDACRNNPYRGRFRSMTRGLAKMDAPRGAILAYATSPGDVAADGEGRNGTYTKHLLTALKEPGVPIERVFKRVRIGVSTETAGAQVPWEESSLMGDFYFRVPSQAATAAPPVSGQSGGRTVELAYWNSIQGSADEAMFRAYLERYPQGAFVDIARLKLKQLEPEVAAARGKSSSAPAQDTSPQQIALAAPAQTLSPSAESSSLAATLLGQWKGRGRSGAGDNFSHNGVARLNVTSVDGRTFEGSISYASSYGAAACKDAPIRGKVFNGGVRFEFLPNKRGGCTWYEGELKLESVRGKMKLVGGLSESRKSMTLDLSKQ